MSTPYRGTLTGRLVRVFLLQALAISLAVVVGVYGAAKVVEKVLVREALDGEAAHFWALFEQQPGHPRPDTANLTGYLQHPRYGDPIPPWLAGAAEEYQRVERPGGDHPLVHVSARDGGRLYLVFEEVQVSRLALLFGIVPLIFLLILVYALTWFGYRASRRAISPMVQLAQRVNEIDANHDDLEQLDLEVDAPPGSEERVLSDALQAFLHRIDDFLTRERNFTRNASHELRTPLAVMRANLDALERRQAAGQALDAPLERMRRTVSDMEKLLETLLILAREDESRLPRDAVIINDLLTERLEQVARAESKPEVEARLEADCLLQVHAPQRVLAIVFDNLLRNALKYTEQGEVVAHIGEHAVEIRDTGPGMDEETLERLFEPFSRGQEGAGGYGLGLTIVKRMCERFGWPIHFDSAPGKGTRVILEFPESEVIGRRRGA
ncbi:MAG: HAMP domain-containing sensor histidine kinase [Xanthomonadales bacterium]|nr:HAMP domain-containing sensor histidine kinase [Xanthomonadales bacterium]